MTFPTDGAAQTVRVVGTVTATPTGTQTVAGTVTANQGTAAVTANAWPTKVGNGSANVDVAPSTPNAIGNALLVSTGSLPASSTLAAVSTGNGTSIDFGSAHPSITLAIIAGAGVSAGAVALEVSHDGTNWFRGTPVTQSAPGVTSSTISGAWRFARGVVSTNITGGTVTATLMGA
jgi:hypothetical protein